VRPSAAGGRGRAGDASLAAYLRYPAKSARPGRAEDLRPALICHTSAHDRAWARRSPQQLSSSSAVGHPIGIRSNHPWLGSLAGFDPLGLSADKEKLKWYVQAELVHGRWAMLGAAGVLAPDVFAHIGLSTAPGAPTNWVEAQTYTYWGSAATIGIVNLWLVSWAEHRRGQDIAVPGSASDDPIFTSNKLPQGAVGYPGGIFDPMNMSSPERKLKEIKNGRLAMVAWLGFIAQAAHTGSYSPIDNLATHLAAPFSTTVLSNFPDLFVWRWNDPTFLANVAPIKGLPLV